MEVKLEGRQVDIGDELKARIHKRMDGLDQRFGPLTHARLSVERKAHKNEQRAEVTVVVNVSGNTITVKKEAATVVAAVNETLEILDKQVKEDAEKKKAKRV